ncbi:MULTISPECIES: peptide deformylase [Myroides]|uniref:Peptide deformylase n=1 Tax=Myroides albus TaxID=2562892 RepID=A0A6I3LIH5_9FLAO|nr:MULTISPECIES: peptide deformylase [Myroides]MTG96980.1 peptide deformylase [Myroides albus]MVX35403.1 peptide deformylase [Myroides sp. LoEW2-1]UVD80530.1 peptide deformylase [Myroides albus]
MESFTPLNEIELNLLSQGSVSEPMRVLQSTDSIDNQSLHEKCKPVDARDPNLKILISRLYATVRDEEKPGVGIAAPQIGINRRVFLAQRLDKKDNPFEFFVNPEIVWYSKVMRVGEEGCLSIPDIYEEVARSLAIQITYYDLEGQHFQEVVEGYTAVILQHEFDHLNGVLFPERIEEQLQEEFFSASPNGELVYRK